MLDDLLTAAGSINWPLTAGTAALFILIARFGLLLLLAVTNNIDPETPESRPRRERTDGVLHLGAVVLAAASVVVAFVGDHGMSQNLAGIYYGAWVGIVLAPLLVFIDVRRGSLRLRPVSDTEGDPEPTTWVDLAAGSVGVVMVIVLLTAPILLLWWFG